MASIVQSAVTTFPPSLSLSGGEWTMESTITLPHNPTVGNSLICVLVAGFTDLFGGISGPAPSNTPSGDWPVSVQEFSAKAVVNMFAQQVTNPGPVSVTVDGFSASSSMFQFGSIVEWKGLAPVVSFADAQFAIGLETQPSSPFPLASPLPDPGGLAGPPFLWVSAAETAPGGGGTQPAQTVSVASGPTNGWASWPGMDYFPVAYKVSNSFSESTAWVLEGGSVGFDDVASLTLVFGAAFGKAPPTRQKPRDDNLALGAVRQGAGKGRSSSVQNSNRQGTAGTYS